MELEELNLRNPINIGYYDPFSIYPLIKEDFEAKLPLTNLHWKYHAAKPVKSIPLLPVKMVEEVPKLTPSSPIPTRPSDGISPSVVETISAYQVQSVYTRMMLIKIESIETYRSQVRPLIKEWLRNLVFKANSEWMIVLFVPQNAKDKQSTFIKTSFFDKLKIDFGTDGKELKAIGYDEWWSNDFNEVERCFKLKETESNIDKLETYNELIALFKSLLLTTFDNKYQDFNDHLVPKASTSDLKQFITKLKYADFFNDMRILQDSLAIYNELYKDLEGLFTTDLAEFSVLQSSSDDLLFQKSADAANGSDTLLSFESSKRIAFFKSKLLEDGKVNLFSMKCLIFINQSILLQSLANFANTISISAIYISNLYQKLIYFLNDLSNTFTHQNLDEFIIFTIDNYLDLPICRKLIEINEKNNENNNNPYQLNEILEFQGELKLFKRSKLVKISRKCGYALNGFKEVLNDLSHLDEVFLDDNKAPQKSDEALQSSLKYGPLVECMKTESTFYDAFETLTEDIISRFVSCNRSKTIDILSIDLALLSYQKGKYQESLNILQNSYDFFIINGWNFMGGVLLEVYLDCIEKLASKDHELILLTCLKLFSSLINNNSTQSIGINNYKLIKTDKSIQSLYSKVIQHSQELFKTMKYPVDQVFTVNVLPWIEADDAVSFDQYYVVLEIINLFGIEFEFEEITLVLSGTESVTFHKQNVTITKEKSNKIKLTSTEFVLGEFVPSRLCISINERVELLKVYDQGEENVAEDTANNTVIKYNQNGEPINNYGLKIENVDKADLKVDTGMIRIDNLNSISYYPGMDKLHCVIRPALTIQLGSTELNLTIFNGSSAIQDLKVGFTSETKGLEVNCETQQIQSLEARSIAQVPVHYTYFSDNKFINIGVDISYSSGGKKFTHKWNEEVDTTLKISVSVQDIFKSNYIYSKFQIGTSNPKSPLRLLENTLATENMNYTIEKPMHSLRPSLITFGEQPASIFFKIVPRTDYHIKSTDSLDLKIDYSSLNEECEKFIENLIIKELRSAGNAKLWFPLMVMVVRQMEFDLNNYAINSFIRVLNQDHARAQARKVTEKYIRDKDHSSRISALVDKVLGDQKVDWSGGEIQVQKNTLLITVPISSLKYLQLLEFDYGKEVKYLVGEPIEVCLKINTITKWFTSDEEDGELSSLAQSSPKLGSDTASATSSPVRFQLTLQNDDNWLISGFKKHTFVIENFSTDSFSEMKLVLIPLNVGKLLFPKVQIKCLSSNTGKDFSMDTEVKNGLETLLVVPDLDSITFSF